MSEERGIFDPKSPDDDGPAKPLESPKQKPMSTRASDYAETGFLAVSRDPRGGGVLIGGGDPPEPAPGLTIDNLVCAAAAGRPACEHYIAFLTDAEGVVKGFEQPKQIRRFCRRMSTASELMEVGEVPIYACTARVPRDERSARLIENFEAKQRQIAEELAQESSEDDL